MTSKTFSSKWVVFKAALKRLKWLGILYGVALLLELPLLLWMELGKLRAMPGNGLAQVSTSHIPALLFNPALNFVNIIVPVIFGLIIFYYLQTERASAFFHSLPVKRGFLYVQNLLAGLVLMWLPILVNGLLIYVVFASFGVTEGQWQMDYIYNSGIQLAKLVPIWKMVSAWLLLSLLMTGLFFIFTVFIGMLTGNILLQGALTFIGLFLPLGLYILLKYNLWRMLYGFSRDINSGTVEWLSPIVLYLGRYRTLFKEPVMYIWYFAVAVALLVASIFLYKARHAEAAGETLAAGWIRWLFKYGVATCTALTGGLYFSTLNENSLGALYLGYLIGAVLGYIIADMIANKSFHFYKRWKGMVAFGAVFVLLISSIQLDIYGYEKYVPEQDEVREVFISNLIRDGYVNPDSNAKGLIGKDNINRVRQLHQQIIKMEKENADLEKSNREMNSMAKPMGIRRMVIPFDITYVLNSGRKVERRYNIDLSRYRELLFPLFTSQEAKRIMFERLFKIDGVKIDQINLNSNQLGKSVRLYERAEIEEALAALKKDIFNISYEAAVEGKVRPQANIEFISKTEVEKSYSFYNLGYYPEFANLNAFLEEHGYLDNLFLKPDDVSSIIIKKVGSNKEEEIKDQQQIKILLNWSSFVDERTYMERQYQPENKKIVEYYGKAVKKDGRSLPVIFDNGPYALDAIEDILNKR